ncbi:MAG: tRNA (adenosine(37)-N6)-threonylcarbamoyltransferase complex transferase subunit TsaD, partial [Bacteroidota bacterium]
DQVKENPNFIQENLNDLCASLQETIIEILLKKLREASQQFGINEIAIAGGVSANSKLREILKQEAVRNKWDMYIPAFKYTTDNAAMIAITGYYKFLKKEFGSYQTTPKARFNL